MMLGSKVEKQGLLNGFSPEQRSPQQGHPLLAIQLIVDRSQAVLGGYPNELKGHKGDGSGCRGHARSNEDCFSLIAPDARQYEWAPGETARLVYLRHLLMSRRHRFIVAGEQIPTAGATAEVSGATKLIDKLGVTKGLALPVDKGYDPLGFVPDLHNRHVVAHSAGKRRKSIFRIRTQYHPSYSKRVRLCPAVVQVHLHLDAVCVINGQNPNTQTDAHLAKDIDQIGFVCSRAVDIIQKFRRRARKWWLRTVMNGVLTELRDNSDFDDGLNDPLGTLSLTSRIFD